jgi:HAE1 family hydrophobic/amphiphilic exporter-1
MGTTVIGGMAAASAIGIFLIPAIFYVVERISGAEALRSHLVPVEVQGD